jgi:hypothetical protein
VQTTLYAMTGDIVVYLMGGTYRLSSTFRLGPQDSGSNGHTVYWEAYPGQTPVIDGAEQVTGWSQYNAGLNIWRPPVGPTPRPETCGSTVCGRARPRARSTPADSHSPAPRSPPAATPTCREAIRPRSRISASRPVPTWTIRPSSISTSAQRRSLTSGSMVSTIALRGNSASGVDDDSAAAGLRSLATAAGRGPARPGSRRRSRRTAVHGRGRTAARGRRRIRGRYRPNRIIRGDASGRSSPCPCQHHTACASLATD